MDVSLPAVLTIATGIGLLVLGADLSFLQWLRSAGQFDLVVGALLVVLGTVTVVRPLPWENYLYVVPFAFFFVGVFLFRNYYLLKPTSQRRIRDVSNSALSAIPGLSGMIGAVVGLEALFVVTYLVALLVILAGFASLLYDVLQFSGGEKVYKRDSVIAAVLMLIGYIYVAIPIANFNPPP